MSYASSVGQSFGKKIARKSRPANVGAQAGQLAGGYNVTGGVGGPTPGQAGALAGAQAGATGLNTASSAAPNANVVGAAATLGGDTGLLGAQDQAQRATGLADAQYQYATNRAGLDYGFNAQGGIDTSNPYGRAALLHHMATNQHRGNTNSYAAQGQLYSGALQNAQDETERQYQIGQDQNYKGYQDALQGAVGARANAYADATTGVSDEALKALLRALGGGS